MSSISGTTGDDTLTGGSEDDSLAALAGNDVLVGGGGHDLLDAGDGDDIVAAGAGADTLVGGAGNDALYSNGSLATKPPPIGLWTPPAEVLDLLADADIIDAGDGNDLIVAGWHDSIDGGAGSDTLYISFRQASVGVQADFHGANAAEGVQIDGAIVRNIESVAWLEGSEFDDLLAPVNSNPYLSFAPIYGLGGNDRIIANYYTGLIDGGDGNDTIDVRSGDATTVSGGNGDDTVYAGDLADLVHGDAGNDLLLGGRGGNHLFGDAGDDVLGGGDSADTLSGGDGRDSIYGGGANDNIDGGVGDDELHGDAGLDLAPFVSDLGNADVIDGGAGNDRIFGELGNDTITGGAGNDTIDGGAGIDVAMFSGVRADYGVLYDAAAHTLTITDAAPGRDGVDVLIDVELVRFSDGTLWDVQDLIAGSATSTAGNDLLVGTDAADTLYGGYGDDTLAGGKGADSLVGGESNDTLFSTTVSQFKQPYYPFTEAVRPDLDTGAESDSLQGGAGNDKLFAGYNDIVDGGAGDNDQLFVSFQGASSGVQADFRLLASQGALTIGAGTITGIEAVSWLEGSNYDDLLVPIGNVYAGTQAPIYGLGGNDHIIAGTYTGDIDGGEGNDLIDTTQSLYANASWGGPGDDTLIGGNGDRQMDGGAGNDLIEGNGGVDQLYGQQGNDTIDGGGSDDYIDGWDGDDVLYGAGDSDFIYGGTGNDIIYGDSSIVSTDSESFPAKWNDTLVGEAGDDVLFGEQGDDVLVGGQGNDYIDGGSGDDTAYYQGNRNEYGFGWDEQDQILVIADSFLFGDGVDFVTGVEHFQFADGLWSFADIMAGAIHPTGGDDLIKGTLVNDSIDAGDGNDTVSGGGGADTIAGGKGADWLFSNNPSMSFRAAYGGHPEVAPELDTGSEPDSIAGGGGDDFIFAGIGDTVDGGDGTDALYISFETATSGVQADFRPLQGGSTVTIDGTSISNIEAVNWLVGSQFDDLLAPVTAGVMISPPDPATGNQYGGFAPVYGLGGNDHIIASRYSGMLDGGAGDDLIDIRGSDYGVYAYGRDGNDTLIGSRGYDDLDGGAGDDVLIASGVAGEDYAGNELIGGAGNDSLLGAYGADILEGDAGDDTLDGGDGEDTVRFVNAAGNLVIDLAAGHATGEGADVLANIEHVLSGSGSDWILGDAKANRIDAGAGNDTVEGGAGNDTLDGGDGIDLLSYRRADAAVVVDISGPIASATGGAGFDILDDFEQVEGSAFADTLAIGWLAFTAIGGGGDDTLRGGAGDDTFVGDSLDGSATPGNDSIDGGAGTDTVVYAGTRSAYSFVGKDGVFTVTGAASGTDTLKNIEWLQFDDARMSLLDSTPPRALNFGPPQGTPYFDVDGELVVNFDEAIRAGSGTVVLKTLDGTPVWTFDPLGETLRVSANSLVLDPGVRLVNGTTYVLQIGGDAIVDMSGNGWAGASLQFRTIPEGAALQGGSANDTVHDTPGNDTIDMGAGRDTVVFSGPASGYSVVRTDSSVTVKGRDGTDTLVNVERLAFDDLNIALDITGNAGQAYRLYQAAFDRAPDLPGLGYQMNALDWGWGLSDIAQNFIDSPEFSARYGSLNDAKFITQLYWNVLHRAPDAAGLEYHLEEFAGGQRRADMLTHFSESQENQANVIDAIHNGMLYSPNW